MKSLKWMGIVAIITLNLCWSNDSCAQFRIGIETGGTISALIPNNNQYNVAPKFGVRAGLHAEYNFKKLVGLRSGIFYEHKGSSSPHLAVDMHTLCLPLLLNFRIDKLSIGIGAECSFNLNHQTPSPSLILFNPVNLGLKSEIAWQFSKRFKLIAHFVCDLGPALEVRTIDDQGFPTPVEPTPLLYRHMGGGLTIACHIFTL